MMARIDIPTIPTMIPLSKPQIKKIKPPIIPRVEPTIPKIDKKDENPIKLNPKPNFVNLILSTEN